MDVLPYVLLVVMSNGMVSESHHSSLALCLQARSLAWYGKTVEEKFASDEEARKRVEDRRTRFLMEHPAHTPTDDERAELGPNGTAYCEDVTKRGRSEEAGVCWRMDHMGVLRPEDNSLVSYGTFHSYGTLIIGGEPAASVSTARCFIEPNAIEVGRK